MSIAALSVSRIALLPAHGKSYECGGGILRRKLWVPLSSAKLACHVSSMRTTLESLELFPDENGKK